MSGLYTFIEKYHEYFKVVPATSLELQHEIFKLRHDIYCEELGYEPTHSSGMEKDAYDDRSLHCLIKNVQTNEFVGGARIVLHNIDETDSCLPFEHTCKDVLNKNCFVDLNRAAIGEISRLGVIKAYRRRKADQGSAFSISDVEQTGGRMRLPYLTLGIYLGLIAMAELKQLTHLFFLTDRVLAASIKKFGVNLEPVGGEIEHRGSRTPYVMHTDHVLDIMNDNIRPFYEMVKQDVISAMAQESEPAEA